MDEISAVVIILRNSDLMKYPTAYTLTHTYTQTRTHTDTNIYTNTHI